jgi:predicted Zn-dependent protease
VKALAEKANAVAETHNRHVTTFNTLYGGPREFHKGEFSGREITVFQFHDLRDLVLLLAHELGHALGITHVDDPAAVMNAMAAAQVFEPLELSVADVAALQARCRVR